MKPRLAITMGDVNGIGPEILAKALSRAEVWETCCPVVVGSAEALEKAQRFASRCLFVDVVTAPGERREGATPVFDGGFVPRVLRPGQIDAEAGRCAVEWMKCAVGLALNGECDGVVTCPLNKAGVRLAGYGYIGHTEILQEMTGCEEVYMSLFADRLRIVHVTGHCPLREVPGAISTERVIRAVRAAEEALLRLGLPRRRLAVAGLNPHAGEGGILGGEEARIIEPAVAACQQEGLDCSGPYPPDTVFRRMYEGEFDLVVALYHDQGHIPFKLMAMDVGVHVTLGLPIVRTSVDHGTAYDIAGKGVAREGSLCAAIQLAARFARAAGSNRSGG